MSGPLDRSSPQAVAIYVQSILQGSLDGSLGTEQRRQATRELLALLGAKDGSNALNSEGARLAAVTALKSLGRTPLGTEDLASESGVRTLLHLSELDSPAKQANLDKELSPIVAEATRCLANVCLLQEPARLRLAAQPKIAEAILERGEARCTPTTRFLGARLLFLFTVSGGSIVRTLVEDMHIASYLSARLDEYIKHLASSNVAASTMEDNIVTDHLKTVFNVSLFYPRLVKEAQNNSLAPPAVNDGRGSPKLGSRRSSSGSSTRSVSPSNGRPASPSNGQKKTTDKIKDMFSRKPKGDRSRTASASSTDGDTLKAWGHESVVSSMIQLLLMLPFDEGGSTGPFGIFRYGVTSLLNYDFSVYHTSIHARLTPASAPRTPALPSTSPSKAAPSLPPFTARMFAMLNATCMHYLPGRYGPDDDSARTIWEAAPENFDECLSFLLLLLAKCAAEDPEGKVERDMRELLLADDIDRSIGLEKRDDLTGRLIRLMSSTYLASSAEAAGKLLFSVCGSDPTTFAAQLGYGNASGFLQNIGQLVPPSALEGASATSGIDSATINPITGAVDVPVLDNEPPMTEAEKEREAERLFVMFDRLNKNGAITVENPITAAKQAGKFASSAEDDAARIREIQDEEDEEEKEALAELARYKERKAKVATAGQ